MSASRREFRRALLKGSALLSAGGLVVVLIVLAILLPGRGTTISRVFLASTTGLALVLALCGAGVSAIRDAYSLERWAARAYARRRRPLHPAVGLSNRRSRVLAPSTVEPPTVIWVLAVLGIPSGIGWGTYWAMEHNWISARLAALVWLGGLCTVLCVAIVALNWTWNRELAGRPGSDLRPFRSD